MEIVCNYYWIPVDGDPFDYLITGPGAHGGSGGSSNNPPNVNLDPHLRRLEACGGLGELYDYGPSNPTGEHPDRIFCEQLQSLYDCLPFLTSDEELVAWYLWYDATYAGDTWSDILDFGCSNSMSPILREEGLKLFQKWHSPGEAYPPFSGWTDFESIWNQIAHMISLGIELSPQEREWLVLNSTVAAELDDLINNYFPYIKQEDFSALQNATSIFLKREMNPITVSEAEAFEAIVGPPGLSLFWASAIQAEYIALKLEHC